jgi:hypothetical protein
MAYAITLNQNAEKRKFYDMSVTLAIETAVAGALFDATRTAESPLPQYRLIMLGQDEALADVAQQYNTSIDVLRMANSLRSDVEFVSGVALIVPQNVTNLDPPRSFEIRLAVEGDTLLSIANAYNVPLDLLEQDNPVLTARGRLIPGDRIFIPRLLS